MSRCVLDHVLDFLKVTPTPTLQEIVEAAERYADLNEPVSRLTRASLAQSFTGAAHDYLDHASATAAPAVTCPNPGA